MGKEKTPTLSQLSFERRQLQKRKSVTDQLEQIESAAKIIAYGCKVLSAEDSLLEPFLSAVFVILRDSPYQPVGETRFNRPLGSSLETSQPPACVTRRSQPSVWVVG